MWSKKYIKLIVMLFVCALLLNKQQTYNRNVKRGDSGMSSRQEEQNFHEVDAFGDDFVDFGAQTGDRGAFSWHVDIPLE